MYYVEMWRSKDGWRWRIKASNGKILASSEAYSNKSACWKTVIKVAGNYLSPAIHVIKK